MPKMTSKGQVTVPKKVREHLGLKPGSNVEFEYIGDGRVAVKSGTDFEERVQREEERIERALAELRGGAHFAMTTDELMRLTRGWGEPDYENSLLPLRNSPGASPKSASTERKRRKAKVRAANS